MKTCLLIFCNLIQQLYQISTTLPNFNNLPIFQQPYQNSTTLSQSNNFNLMKVTSMVRLWFYPCPAMRSLFPVQLWKPGKKLDYISYQNQRLWFCNVQCQVFKLTYALSIIVLLQQCESQASNHFILGYFNIYQMAQCIVVILSKSDLTNFWN